jgi:Methyltransferase domain
MFPPSRIISCIKTPNSVSSEGAGHLPIAQGQPPMDFFDRHDRFFQTSIVGTRLPNGNRSPRLSYRYQAIIERNRALFPKARVLDLASHDGRWSLAALDAGATYVAGIEGRHAYVAAACENFTAYNVASNRYSFVQGDVPSSMSTLESGSFDLILCLGIFYHTIRHYDFFEQFYRLNARHVILDTEITPANDPLVLFRYENHQDNGTLQLTKGMTRSIVGIPSHAMIAMLAEHFQFAWKMVDWNSFGITRWDGIDDYQSDRRRTYVLQRG